MKKIMIVIIVIMSMLTTYGCSSSVKKSDEEFAREVYHNLADEFVMSEDTMKTEAEVIEKSTFVAKVIPTEINSVVGDVSSNKGEGEQFATAYVFDIVELYYDETGMYGTGEKIKVVSLNSISNFNEKAINLQIGQEYIVFVEQFSTEIISTIANYTNNLIVDSSIAVIPVTGNEYTVNTKLSGLLKNYSDAKQVSISVNETLAQSEFLQTEILPFSKVITDLMVITEDNMKDTILAYINK